MSKSAKYISGTKTENEIAKRMFGEKILSLLNDHSMSQSDLERLTGIKRDAISRYVRGASWPEQHTMKLLANAFNVLPRDLVPGMSDVTELIISQSAAERQAAQTGSLLGFNMQMLPNGMFRVSLNAEMLAQDALAVAAVVTNADKRNEPNYSRAGGKAAS